ncbi:hypothetical protein HII31_03278 [Pseudocercospora fuligena]|uniref:Uncharacterized protein n=1 Tax=Pseudocercospora fuligena TaxID=685502 RepID=A0A8H6RQP3_9PEZI|nr:hypothetical protein HII31_03278 [Pseudocercospora fuligena]
MVNRSMRKNADRRNDVELAQASRTTRADDEPPAKASLTRAEEQRRKLIAGTERRWPSAYPSSGSLTKEEEDTVTIQPHSDQAGNAIDITGDAYSPANPSSVAAWSVEKEGYVADQHKYLNYVKKLSKSYPHLEYFAHWMEVTCAPPKWKYIEHNEADRIRRAKKTKVCIIDYHEEDSKDKGTTHEGDEEDEEECSVVIPKILKPRSDQAEYLSCEASLRVVGSTVQPGNEWYFDNAQDLAAVVRREPEKSVQARLIVVEDLSREVVEVLGCQYDIDPSAFLSHTGDYLYNQITDRWADLPELDVDARGEDYVSIQYLRPLYFSSDALFERAERQTGLWNVLRRLDSDRSRERLRPGNSPASVTLLRSRTTLWVKPRADSEAITAILLVDPTVTAGFPLWRDHRPFEKPPSYSASIKNESLPSPPRATLEHGPCLFDDIVYWSLRRSAKDMSLIIGRGNHEACIAFPMYKLVITEWLKVLKYMTATLTGIDWQFDNPAWVAEPQKAEELQLKLRPWHRNIHHYQSMINEAIIRLNDFRNSEEDTLGIRRSYTMVQNTDGRLAGNQGLLKGSMASLSHDWRNVQQQMTEVRMRMERVQNLLTESLSIQDGKRSIEEGKRARVADERANLAAKENKHLARITTLATIFIPLQFTSGFLSINNDFGQKTRVIWLFFAIGVTLTVLALFAVAAANVDDRPEDAHKPMFTRAWLRILVVLRFREKTVKANEKPPIAAPDSVRQMNGSHPGRKPDATDTSSNTSTASDFLGNRFRLEQGNLGNGKLVVSSAAPPQARPQNPSALTSALSSQTSPQSSQTAHAPIANNRQQSRGSQNSAVTQHGAGLRATRSHGSGGQASAGAPDVSRESNVENRVQSSP